ncbi:MAG: hypothetical protein KGD61_10985 [Candidatus Lokiarchaeota archaeon]|nr:hypothetical protein [Candidatus Lokiarchaeota archaeon]
MKNKKSVIILLGIMTLSMFLFTPPAKADTLDYKHRREFAGLSPNQSEIIWFNIYSTE